MSSNYFIINYCYCDVRDFPEYYELLLNPENMLLLSDKIWLPDSLLNSEAGILPFFRAASLLSLELFFLTLLL